MTCRRVQFFTWESHDGTTKKFSIDAALELIRQIGLQPECDITLPMAEECLRRNYRQHELESKHVAKADLNEPLIMVTLYDTLQGRYAQVLIDGWHRLKKMVLLGRTEPLKAYILSPSESQCIEVGEIIYQ